MKANRALCAVAALLLAGALGAFGAANGGFQDGIDRNDPNFVTASLLVIGPGNQFFGCAGHSSLRLECPAFGLDTCFTCESEPICEYPFRFVMGNLKMGMFALKTKEFLKFYERDGRRATQYRLNLPPDAKQRLWKIMDEQASKGHSMHYDYIKYCCVQTIIQPILKAIRPYPIEFPRWPEKYKLTRREILADNLSWCNWTRFFLHTISGTEVDRMVRPEETVILSQDFVDLFRGTKVMGKFLIDGPGEVVQPHQNPLRAVPFTPMMAAVLLLVLAGVSWFWGGRWIGGLFLFLQTAIGLLLTHLLCLSNLPATSWNWLIVPFNVLPLVGWRWRRYWAWPFAAVLVAWEALMILWPHQLTDPAYLVIVAAYILFYAKVGRRH